MVEKIIGDPKLRGLFKENKVAFEIGEPVDEYGLRPINIIFPGFKQLPKPEDLTCPACQKPAQVIFENRRYDFSRHGLYVEFQNIRKFQVEGCLVDLIDDSVYLKEFARWKRGYHSSVIDLDLACINGGWVQGHAETIGWTLTIMNRAFTDLHHPAPQINEIKSALQYALS